MITVQEFLVISPRGDTLITKNYTGAVNRTTTDSFLQRCKKDGKKSTPPVFQIDGLTFCHVQQNGMYFVFTTVKNVQAATLIELLHRLSRVFKDYLGVLTEESVRRNFLLLYELLDEVFDSGCPQGMSTELLKAYVYNEPVAVSSSTGLTGGGMAGSVTGKLDKLAHSLSERVSLGEKKTLASAAANKPIQVTGDKKDNTIFVDVIEKLTVVIDSKGQLKHSYINGAITLRSFMAGSPEMRLGLSDSLTVKSLDIPGGGTSGGAQPTLPVEDMNFHECVRWEEGSKEPVFTFFAPDGEFTLLNYRIKSAFRPPISVQPFLEPQHGSNGLDYVLRVRAEFPPDKCAAHVTIQFALPAWANSVSVETACASGLIGGDKGSTPSAGKAEYDRKTHVVGWSMPKLPGGSEMIIRAKIVLAQNRAATACKLDEFGVVRVGFELPMYLLSGVQIKFLDFLYSSSKSTPNKWIRYVTQALSYVARWS